MYGKLFESTFTGSMYAAGPVVFAVWGYVVAHTKPPGRVEVNPKVVAATLGCKVEEVTKALRLLTSPDAESRNKEHEGRRMLKIGEFLYDVPSWPKYNAMRNDDERRAYNAEKMRQSRARRKGKKADVTRDVNDSEQSCTTVYRGVPSCTHADADAKADADAEKRKTPAATPPAAVAADVHLKAVGWFSHRFQELRGVKYEITQRDRSETHRLLVKQGVDRGEWAKRAERMLNHRVRFHFENASPAHLAEKWNVFALDDSAGPTAVDKKVQEADAVLARLNGEARA